ncbi:MULTISPECIES: ABC transporter ATP-binding protein [unclassified Marinobacterium]|jgi:putative ABC transport system ATP-binding protein|uniref:ABC transporter ATP-binding protein n=1 Tax=unclassified Marinobacterium TaxID=2644139 RepID=UPI001568851E|nr:MULTISPECIES: ABC transporter ATP-binding protein [unclassified Marinobacterium]NRP14743.1 Lipoprotein-releasing system ATP-binding protein LolD [Marinobacterium sp. xm-a-152]NRP57998.1 Lipoprotein-releasing system ATP-binding protein LolD [Marinobacterium sp. xm-d-510]NRP94859.1 Lipoprotein-releasing system ATP-binding protein LolD [Marinobacterium sp. xm-g-59]NRP98229.1 Lipoprotein-releasing system ATP-binding protein LolD [Marinobacterium sp. xm-a-127]
MTSRSVLLEAKQLGKQFKTGSGTLDLFVNLNLTINAGETIAIIGKSGAGKSTLLSLLAGLDTATSGTVEFEGKPLESLSDAERAKLRADKIAFIFQSFHLLPELTAQDNVALPLEIRQQQNAEATASEWLQNVGLGDRTDHYPSQLSGGEQQRVAIARAFAGNPALLFADEPTGNLDEATGQQIVEQLFSLNEQQGTTLILITHDLELAKRCQRRIQLSNGAIEELS